MYFTEDEIFMDQDHIDPSKIVLHDWRKLCSMWKSLNAEYKAAVTRFTQSGTHTDCFYSYCNGKLDVYYLRLHLQLRPGLNGTIEAALPEETFLLSDMDSSERIARNSCYSDEDDKKENDQDKRSRASGSDRKRKKSEVAEAIRECGNSKMTTELANKKLHYMNKDEKRKETQSLNDTWQMLQINICNLRNDLREPESNEGTKNEIREDITGLKKRKDKIARQLGFK